MGKSPSKRRRNTLGERAGSPDSFELLTPDPAPPASLPTVPTPSGADRGGDEPGVRDERAVLRRENADLDARWRRQADQIQEQLAALTQQCEQLALQTARLQALAQRRQGAGRAGVLLALMSLSAVVALGY